MGRCDQLGVTLVAGLGSSEDFCTLMSGPWQGQLGLAGMVNQSAWGWPLGVVASGLQQMGQHTWGIPAHQSCPCCRGPPRLQWWRCGPPSSWEGCPGRCSLNTATLSLSPVYFNLRAIFHHSVFCPVNKAHSSSNLPPPHSRPSPPIHFPRPCYRYIYYGIRQTVCISSIISIVLCCKSHCVSCVFSKLHKRTSPCCPCAMPSLCSRSSLMRMRSTDARGPYEPEALGA